MLKLSDAEIEARAELIRADLVASGSKLRLFKNNYTPVDGVVLGDLVEADFNGYAAVTLDWTDPAVVSSSIATVTAHLDIVYTKSVGGTGNDVYGYFVTDSAGTVLLWAERDPAAPVDMNTDGATYTVTARFTGKSQ